MVQPHNTPPGAKFFIGVLVDTPEDVARVMASLSAVQGGVTVSTLPAVQEDVAPADQPTGPQPNPTVVSVLLDGLNSGPLPPRYRAMFNILLEAGDKQVSLPDLAAQMGEVKGTVSTMVAKLSGRVRKGEEKAQKNGKLLDYPERMRPIDALLDIYYEKGHAFYRLTTSGR